MNDYRVHLEVYNGPLDLLLFLIKREEVDIYDIPIATVTEQYLEYVHVLKEVDPESVGEFLVLAATLMEIKSRMLLPKTLPVEDDEDFGDPRLELVHQLLQYKEYKNAARHLEDAAAIRSLQHERVPASLPADDNEIELDNLEIWDLYEAFNRLLEQTGRRDFVHRVSVDDTPLRLHADDIVDALEQAGGSIVFAAVFAGRSRGEMIGLFLALLELLRCRRVRASQDDPNGPIYLHVLEELPDVDYDEQMEVDDRQTSGAILAARARNAGDVLPPARETLHGDDEAEPGAPVEEHRESAEVARETE